jgi:phosphatidate cytidylyltransferase
MVLTVANDSGAFIVGRQYGKRPLNKLLSPNKTLEGTAAGTIVAVIV